MEGVRAPVEVVTALDGYAIGHRPGRPEHADRPRPLHAPQTQKPAHANRARNSSRPGIARSPSKGSAVLNRWLLKPNWRRIGI